MPPAYDHAGHLRLDEDTMCEHVGREFLMSSGTTNARLWIAARLVRRDRAPSSRAGWRQCDLGVLARGSRDGDDVIAHAGLDANLAHLRLHRPQVIGRGDRRQRLERSARSKRKRSSSLRPPPDSRWQLDEKAIHLRLRQRERAFQFNRVLRRQHQKRTRQQLGLAIYCDLLFCIASRAPTGCAACPIDFVGQQHLAKDRSGANSHSCDF